VISQQSNTATTGTADLGSCHPPQPEGRSRSIEDRLESIEKNITQLIMAMNEKSDTNSEKK
jgi:hypothetical protein